MRQTSDKMANFHWIPEPRVINDAARPEADMTSSIVFTILLDINAVNLSWSIVVGNKIFDDGRTKTCDRSETLHRFMEQVKEYLIFLESRKSVTTSPSFQIQLPQVPVMATKKQLSLNL